MRCLFLLIAMAVAGSSQTLDSYGGRLDKPCPSGVKTRFYTDHIASRWWLCTPAGNAMWAQGVYAVNIPDRNAAMVKYGDSSLNVAFDQTISRLKSWGFNFTDTYSAVDVLAWNRTVKFPAVYVLNPANYAMNDGPARANNPFPTGLLDQPVKNLSQVMSPYFRQVATSMPDWGDLTRIGTALNWLMTQSGGVDPGGITKGLTHPDDLKYLIGISIEDSDQTWGYFTTVADNPYPVQVDGMGAASGAYMTAIMSPLQQVDARQSASYLGDPVVYAKSTLHDYLQTKYGTIGALNTAWGSSYTTFGSGATTVSTPEAIGTTDGTSYQYAHTIALAGNLTPHSIRLYHDGSVIAGDCYHPLNNDACNPQSGSYGTIWGPTGVGGFVDYAAGQITVTYTTPWVRPDSVDCTAGVSCTAWFVNSPGYVAGNHISAQGFPTTSFAVSNVVIATKGTSAHLFSGDFCAPTTVTATFITYPWAGGTITAQGICSGDAGRFARITPPAAGIAITMDYSVNGWDAGGTGLMDEDGRPSHTWMGTDPFTGSNQTSDPYTLHTLNANTAADLRSAMYTLARNYFVAMRSGVRQPFLDLSLDPPMYLGPDSFGTWAGTPTKEVLQAASGVVDMAIFGGSAGYTLTSDSLAFIAAWYGHPFIDGVFLRADPDSRYAAFTGSLDYATQAARGAGYTSIMQAFSSSAATSGRTGFGWWQYTDNSGENANWGLISLNDNAYDGHESVTGSVACSAPNAAYSCGGEPGNYGDVITPVKTVNALWLSDAGAVTNSPVRISGNVRIGGSVTTGAGSAP